MNSNEDETEPTLSTAKRQLDEAAGSQYIHGEIVDRESARILIAEMNRLLILTGNLADLVRPFINMTSPDALIDYGSTVGEAAVALGVTEEE